MEQKYLNVTDLCRYIYKSESYVYKMVGKKQIPFHKVGRQLLFEISQIDKWVKSGYVDVDNLPDLPDLI